MSSVLANHRRQPKIYIDIPSQLRFVKDGTTSSSFKDVPVYSMTGADELMMKNPEALLNGSATMNLIKSCIPSIVNPGQISVTDVEYLLVSIRIASYGESYNQHSRCPHCGEENVHGVPLGNVLDQLSNKQYLDEVKVNDLTFKLNPLTYEKYTEIEKLSFETQRLLSQTLDKDMTQETRQQVENQAYGKLNQVLEEGIAGQVVEIVTPEGSEVDPREIREFILSSDREYFETLKTTIEKNNLENQIDEMVVQCGSCSKEYKQLFTMDDSSFFGK